MLVGAWTDVLQGAAEVGLVSAASLVPDSVERISLGWLADVLAIWVLRIRGWWALVGHKAPFDGFGLICRVETDDAGSPAQHAAREGLPARRLDDGRGVLLLVDELRGVSNLFDPGTRISRRAVLLVGK